MSRYGSATKESSSDNSSPATQSPNLDPTNVPSHGNAPSPPLGSIPREIAPQKTVPWEGMPQEAVSATSYATSSTTRSTAEWMRGVPGLGSSPGGNLINLMGESPPTQPSSYEDGRSVPSGWPSPANRQYYTGQLPSASPPIQSRRPLSYHMDNQYSPSEAYAPSAASIRRSSLHSQSAYARGMMNPPLPHQPQAHFYGAPEIDLDLNSKSGIRAGERGYAYGFDNLTGPQGMSARGKDTVVLTGYEGGLEVHSVTKNGLDTIASLKGLRGGVHYAKILPWALNGPGQDPSPLVAVVVHGPMMTSSTLEVNAVERSGAASPAGTDMGQRDANGIRTVSIDFYQTTVDVYSLQDSRHIAVLLEGPKIPLGTSITNPIFQPPPPTGALRILAENGNIVVASGQTGESWIYRQASIPHEPKIEFRCLGKLWTTIQQDPFPDSERSRPTPQRLAMKAPIIALRGKWIAYCPAAPSSQMGLRANVPGPKQGKAPGLTSHTPPQLPSVVSDVDLPGADSIMNKLMRETTQEVISGAKWIGERGLQAFNSYWNKPAQQPRSPTSAQSWNVPFASRPEPQFPPTHGASAPAVSKEPGLVSIVDLETSLNSISIHPLTTFATSGCSFLSFSPNGLSLFTASTKGDIQTVWDLLRIQYTKLSPLHSSKTPSSSNGPRVRQVAQFSRMTVARIVDVSWMKPRGECVAMVTERGTVHLLDLPSSAFLWPPPRRRIRQQETASNTTEGNNSAVAMAAGALTTAWDVARPLINRSRRSSSIANLNMNATHSTGSRIVGHANYGGKMIAAGISHSLGKTGSAINHLRHSGDNRISLPSGSNTPGPSCVILVANRKDHSLFVLGNGFVRTFPQRPRRMSSGEKGQSATQFRRYKDFKLPMLPEDVVAPAVKRLVDPDEYLDLLDKDGDGINTTLVLKARPKPTRHTSAESSIPQAEIESSAPYQPFHTDRRVVLYEFAPRRSSMAAVAQLPTVSVLLADPHMEDKPFRPSQLNRRKDKGSATKAATNEGSDDWAFGQPIAVNRISQIHVTSSDEEAYNASTEDFRTLPQSAMERSVARHMDVGDEEQIVVTTRRRRGGGRNGDTDDDGFFEDDCEVLDFADQRV